MLGICFFTYGGEYKGEPVCQGEKGGGHHVLPGPKTIHHDGVIAAYVPAATVFVSNPPFNNSAFASAKRARLASGNIVNR